VEGAQAPRARAWLTALCLMGLVCWALTRWLSSRAVVSVASVASVDSVDSVASAPPTPPLPPAPSPKPPPTPLKARVTTLSPAPWQSDRGESDGGESDGGEAPEAPRRAVALGAQEVGLRAGGARLKVSVALSARTGEAERVLWAMRGRAREVLHFLVSHRAPAALTLPDAEERLRADLSARLHRLIPSYDFEVELEGFEVIFDESEPE
jgi:hypothetical protein